jgi:multiple sugar transport system permease protein
MRRTFRKIIGETAFFIGVGIFVILAAFPFYWMLITAFKPNSDLYNITNVPFFFNEWPTLEHVKYLFQETLFARWLWNSLIIGVCVVAITLVTAIPAGYSLARMTSRKSEALGIATPCRWRSPTTCSSTASSRASLAGP